MELEKYSGLLPRSLDIRPGDFCNVLPEFIRDLDKYDIVNNSFTKEQFVDLITRQIDIRVISKAKLTTTKSIPIGDNWWSYFRIEWYDDSLMYDLYIPDKYLKTVRYIYKGDYVVINKNKLEQVFDTFMYGDTPDQKEYEKNRYKKAADDKLVLEVTATIREVEPKYNKFSNWWVIATDNNYIPTKEEEEENNYIGKIYQLPDWCLDKPAYMKNKKPVIKKYFNY